MQLNKNIQIPLMKKKNKIFLTVYFHFALTSGPCYGIIKAYVELVNKFEFSPSFKGKS